MKLIKIIKSNVFVIILIAALILAGVFSFGINLVFSAPKVALDLPKFVDEASFSGLEFGTAPDANASFILYADTQCPYTAEIKEELRVVYEYYNQDINFVLKHFPLENIHPDAVGGAQAVECASDQGKKWEYFLNLLDNPLNQKPLDLKRYASDLGLDEDEFAACLDSGVKFKKVEDDLKDAIIHDIPGTPTMFIGGRELQGIQNEATLSLAIKEALK